MSEPINFIAPSLCVIDTATMGRGVFTDTDLEEGVVIEIAPVIVMPPKDRGPLDETLLHDYIFEWGENQDQCAMALGYVPLYNHAYHSNCEYEMDFDKALITVKTTRFISAGEELFINYNGDFDNDKPVWFDAK